MWVVEIKLGGKWVPVGEKGTRFPRKFDSEKDADSFAGQAYPDQIRETKMGTSPVVRLQEHPDIPQFTRAGATVLCEMCGMSYQQHAPDRLYLDWEEQPYLRRLCDDRRVKL